MTQNKTSISDEAQGKTKKRKRDDSPDRLATGTTADYRRRHDDPIVDAICQPFAVDQHDRQQIISDTDLLSFLDALNQGTDFDSDPQDTEVVAAAMVIRECLDLLDFDAEADYGQRMPPDNNNDDEEVEDSDFDIQAFLDMLDFEGFDYGVDD